MVFLQGHNPDLDVRTPVAIKAEALKTLLEIDAFGAPIWDTGQRARLIRAIFKLERGRMVTAVIGEFSAGKSTLVNSLLGAEWLPMEIQPTTAVTCEITYGQDVSARVVFASGESQAVSPDQLAGFLDNSFNPENKKGIKTVYLACPSELLKSGVVLVDTPGTASIFAQHEELTFAFLQRADACLLVLSMDRPLTRDGLDFFLRIRRYMGKVFILLNKCDGYEPEEIDEQVRYVKKHIEAEVGALVRVIPVSARLGLRARKQGDPQLLEASGLPSLIAQLQEFFTRGVQQVLLTRASLEAAEILRDTAAALAQRREALEVILHKEKEAARAKLKAMEGTLQEKRAAGETVKQHLADIFAVARKAITLWLDKNAGRIKLELENTVRENSLDWCREHIEKKVDKMVGDLAVDLEEVVDRELKEAEHKALLKVATILEDIRGIKTGDRRPGFTGLILPGSSNLAGEISGITNDGIRWGMVTAVLTVISFFFPPAAIAAGGSYLIGAQDRDEQKKKIVSKINSHLEENIKKLKAQAYRYINLRERLLSSQVLVRLQQTVDAMTRALEEARRQLEAPPETIRREIAKVKDGLGRTESFLARLTEIDRANQRFMQENAQITGAPETVDAASGAAAGAGAPAGSISTTADGKEANNP